MNYLGDFAEDATIYVMFNTFSSDDPSASVTITNFINTDVHIHKDDGLTQRNNAAGITVSVDFDGITGSHMIKIDTSDNTVAGFWVTGSDYFVRIEGTTIDGATINAVVAHFSIENRFMRGTNSANTTVPDAAGTAAGLHSTTDGKVDAVQTDVTAIAGDVVNIDGAAMRGTDGASTHSAADAADAVWNETASGHTDVGKAGQQLWTDIDAVLNDTNEIHGKLPTNYIMGSSVQSDKDDEISAVKIVTDKLDDTVEDDAGVYRFTANALEEAPTGSGASAADIADAVWNETSTGHTGAGKAGAQLWTEIDDVLADTDEIQSLISNSKIAAQIKGMDANTLTGYALATDAVNKIRDAIMDATVDGSIDVGKCLKAVLAVLAGDMANVNNTYMYKDQSDTTIVTEVVGESAVERAIA